jgi:Na+-driven multidrug efflux pump
MPNLAAISLAIAAAVNIILDYWFIVIYDWGLTGAALATGLSQAIPMLVLLAYFGWPKRRLQFAVRQQRWREVFQAAYNGLSEFINEVSGGIIAFIFNWMLIERAGVDGVAAITVVNYLMLLGFMMFFSISDTIAVMVSQNFGAGEVKRIEGFLKLASIVVAVTSAVFIGLLLTMSEPMIAIFVDEKNSAEMMQLAQDFVPFFWPVFLFVGFNMLASGYLTAVHRPFESGLIALFRSLVLPAGFLVLFYFLLTDYQFVAAVAVAEAVAFGVAMALYFRWRPSKVL